MNCPNCGRNHPEKTCSCQFITASDGKKVCNYCSEAHEKSIAASKIKFDKEGFMLRFSDKTNLN